MCHSLGSEQRIARFLAGACLLVASLQAEAEDRRGGIGGAVVGPREPEQVRIQPTGRSPVQEVRLDGTWLFCPVEGSLTAQALDAEARRIAAAPADRAGWFPLAVPQFLNRYAWWLDISKKFVAADEARLAALPFDAEKTQSGWYRRTLELPPVKGEGPEVVADFEGVAMISRVYCNGQFVGGHVGMFGAFGCRLTPHLNWGSTNTLLVYAERGGDVQDADQVLGVAVTVAVTRGMLASLNHGMFGGFGRGAFAKFLGIWQPVTLKVSQPGGRIADVFFRPALTGHVIEFAIENRGAQPACGTLACWLTDLKTGKIFHQAETQVVQPIATGSTHAGKLEAQGLDPRLWTPDDPNLYELALEWRAPDGRPLDRWTHKVGYRTVAVKGAQLQLNGRPYWTRGAGMPVYGYKPNDEVTARAFLRRMHQGNQMVTRSGCNPWNELWFGVADEEGVGVACEGVRPWALMGKTPPPEKALLEHWRQEQLETVRQYRNHPSILVYCIANEGLQGDHENPEKLAVYRAIIEAVRAVDPTRPICQTSGEPDAGGQADIEDVHSYWGWYEHSSFVFDYDKPRRGLHTDGRRPFINKETAVPYQDTDTGAVHPGYVHRYSAHPWVGELGAEGADPSYFAEHIRAETKLKTEKLRRQRKALPTAGMILFANTTWVGDVLTAPPKQWKPFPVWEGVRPALAPVLVGWTTTRHVFFAGDTLRTGVFVTNDDARFRDLKGLTLKADVLDVFGHTLFTTEQPVGDVAYFDVCEYPLELKIPATEGCDKEMTAATVRLSLSDSAGAVSENVYPIRIVARGWASPGGRALEVVSEGCSRDVQDGLRSTGARVLTLAEAEKAGAACDVAVLGPEATRISEAQVSKVLKPGGRVIALQQGAAARRLCPDVFPQRQVLVWGKPSGYELRPLGFCSGARWATDRDFTLTEVPARLAGATQIITRMDDKASDASQPLLRFWLPSGGRVAVAYDSRARECPEWLREWTRSGDKVGTSAGLQLNLFEKEFSPGEVRLGGNLMPGATAMYAVAILPASGRAVERLERARQGAGKVGADNELDHFMFEKAADVGESTFQVTGEFVEMLGWMEGRPLFDGLDAMDWKWWACGEGQPAFACTAAHRIDVSRKDVVPLGRYLESHFYWSGDLRKVYESKLTWPVFAVQRPWGTLVVCELAVSEAISLDPRAARTLSNLISQPLKTGPLPAGEAK